MPANRGGAAEEREVNLEMQQASAQAQGKPLTVLFQLCTGKYVCFYF